MFNNFVLVGKIEEINEIEKEIIISVPRFYEEGSNEKDYIKIKLPENIYQNVYEYSNIGDTVGIKGKIQSSNKEVELLTEKITLLNNRKEEK